MPKTRAPKSSRFVTKPAQGLPDRETLLNYVRDARETGRADIARAFGLKGNDRRALREMLVALEAEGALGKRGRKGLAETGALPPVGVVDVIERDNDGELIVKLVKGDDAPRVRLAAGRHEPAAGAPALGDRLLVKFEALESGETVARLIKRLAAGGQKLLGVVRKSRREVRLEPVNRKSKESLILFETAAQDLRDGDLVVAQIGTSEGRYGPKRGKILEVKGN